MYLPMKALHFCQLTIEKSEFDFEKSSHDVSPAFFRDIHDKKVSGYYKPLDKNYPPLLAKIAVAYSISLRTAVERVAEDRLVMDDNGNILGTFSTSIPFKPMLCRGNTPPSDPQDREEVCPSVSTLLKYNMAELLVALWRIKNDDSHPGNVSVHGLIDFDMAGYQKLTSIIKGARVSAIISENILTEEPVKAMELKQIDISDFPILPNKFTHWPANIYPGNFNVGIPIIGVAGKSYEAYQSFRDLAKNPVLQTEAGDISFQEQMFTALLKELLVYDPEMERHRFYDYFGNLTLNYTSIGERKSTKLAEMSPELFNDESENQLFVEFCARYFQDEYNELYRTVVFYPGCKANESKTPVMSFQQFLHEKPDAYSKIKDWAIRKNEKMAAAWGIYIDKYDTDDRLFQSDECFEPGGRYNLERMEQRYHKIWRDSHVTSISMIFSAARSLSKKLYNDLRLAPLRMSPQIPLNFEDRRVTEAWQFTEGEYKEIRLPPPNEDENKGVRECLILLNAFIKDLQTAWSYYLRLPLDRLTLQDNLNFCSAVGKAIFDYDNLILSKLDFPSWTGDYLGIVKELKQFYEYFNLQHHLVSAALPGENKSKNNASIVLQNKHTDEEIIALGLKILFDWAGQAERHIFDGAVEETICHYEQKSAQAGRSNWVRAYLKSSEDSNDNKLARIMSMGGMKTTSLNCLLMENLLRYVLKDSIAMVHVNLMSIKHAFERNEFDVLLYTKKAKKYATEDCRFTHICSLRSSERFNKIMYRWVDLIPFQSFQKYIQDALKIYKGGYFNSFLSNKSRDREVSGLLKNKSSGNAYILASIFSNGAYNKGSSLNNHLFGIISKSMQDYISNNQQARSDKEFLWILEIDFKNEEQNDRFLMSLKDFATEKLKTIQSVSLNYNCCY